MRDRQSMSASSVSFRSALRREQHGIATPARTGAPAATTHRVTVAPHLQLRETDA
ncbi:hypothetical protein [Nocardia asiatica]|uniref:hypothetical protein n=1 Tax=Nocardia asiatica TaxID=209252 RepID=UPI0024560922|nr:hypothetical protein [Nocardia asiatica]